MEHEQDIMLATIKAAKVIDDNQRGRQPSQEWQTNANNVWVKWLSAKITNIWFESQR